MDSGSSSGYITPEISNSNSYKTTLHSNIFNNHILLKLEEDEFITPDEKAEELLKNLTKSKHLYALKLLFENPLNRFTPKILRDSLIALADPESFDYYDEQSVARLELHLRTWVAVLEQICFTKMRLSKNLRDRIYNSLPKFAEIHRKTTQVIQEGFDNKYVSDFNQFNQLQISKEDENIIKKRNYNIDFLLIHLRDTLHSLRDDETWFQEIIRRTKDFLKVALNITPGILTMTGVSLPNDCSILSILNQVRQSLSFKYPVASYYVDWRIMLIIQHNLFIWVESSEKIISKKFGELVLIEYIWGFLERELINVTNKSILDSQTKFEEVSNKVAKTLKNTGSFLSDLAGNEPLALPHTLWFGILDLAQNLIQKSTRIATYGLCYYLAIESLNKAPSSFIQFKAVEILLYLYDYDNQMFSMIEIDFNQYIQKLNENKPTYISKKFQNLLIFVKEKYFEDLKILNDDVDKEMKRKGKEKISNQSSSNILDIIADEMTCPISSEPTDQLCILKCQHTLSLYNLKKLKQKICPECREKIEENDIRYLSQNFIYKNLYSKFSESGHILQLENSGRIDCNDSDTDSSEDDLILTKKKKTLDSIKSNSRVSLQSVFQIRNSKKQHPIYQNVLKELDRKNYEKAEYFCKEILNFFPKSYSLRCILAYVYRCLNNYEQAHLYLKEAINLKQKEPIAYFLHGEIFFWQSNYPEAIYNINKSLNYKAKINNLYIIRGNNYLYSNHYTALYNYNIALVNNPNSYLCLKTSAYCYEKIEQISDALRILDQLLNINKEDSLILCYYGEILCKITKYSEAISYFTKANIIDPENIHNLNKRAIAYYILQEYDKALTDLDKVMRLDPLNSLAYYLKSLTYYTIKNINNAIITFEKFTELLSNSDDILAKIQLFHLEYLLNKNKATDLNNTLTKINQIYKIENHKLLLLFRCKIFIELKKYYEAKLDLDILYDSIIFNYEYISYIYLLQEYSDFWLYVCEINDDDFSKLGIINEFNKYIYIKTRIYFISNLINLNSELCQFQESDSNSLSGQVLHLKCNEFCLNLPTLGNEDFIYIICKINIEKILSEDYSIEFRDGFNKVHILDHEDISKIEGLGWIEYRLSIFSMNPQLTIEVKGSIDMKIDYIRLGFNRDKISYIPNMSYLLPDYHKFYPSIPEAFKDNWSRTLILKGSGTIIKEGVSYILIYKNINNYIVNTIKCLSIMFYIVGIILIMNLLLGATITLELWKILKDNYEIELWLMVRVVSVMFEFEDQYNIFFGKEMLFIKFDLAFIILCFVLRRITVSFYIAYIYILAIAVGGLCNIITRLQGTPLDLEPSGEFFEQETFLTKCFSFLFCRDTRDLEHEIINTGFHKHEHE
ncbi:hypothetical protein GLOIN_2v1869728 [Rhizophagus clarus]|nr:hypothetical protein GLOIN_2v1869728 [Rhizophagus clarus]